MEMNLSNAKKNVNPNLKIQEIKTISSETNTGERIAKLERLGDKIVELLNRAPKLKIEANNNYSDNHSQDL
jgi:hypothetical protein